jgi:outer membrane PBP1 activator LpoA protein
MSVSRSQIEAELQAAEHALEEARERRKAARQILWGDVSRSSKDTTAAKHVAEARRELADAEEQGLQAETLVRDLRKRLLHAQERETRLLAITDMLIAREEAQRADEAHAVHRSGHGPKRNGHRSLIDRLRGR